MNKTTSLLILLLIWIGLGSFVCEKWNCAEKTVAATVAKAPPILERPLTWDIQDGSAFTSSADGFIRFNASSKENLAFSAGVQQNIDKAIAYLKNNPDRQMTIVGRYMDTEQYSGLFPNLGEARANQLKSVFKAAGVPTKQMGTTSELVGAKWFKNNILDQAADFKFNELFDEDPRVKQIADRLLGKPMTVYFQTGESDIQFSQQQRTDLADMVYYIDKTSGAGLSIDGHTDNVGARGYNVNLSKERAAEVQAFVAKRLGLEANQYKTDGFGPDKPIAPNTTEEGKAKNRRVEITLTNLSSSN